MSMDRDAMYALFEQQPGDLAAYGAMGDELDSLGYASLAHAFRWMCFRGAFPHCRTHYAMYAGVGNFSRANVVQSRRCPAKFRWAWYSYRTVYPHTVAPGYPKSLMSNHMLPLLLIGTCPQKLFASHQAAVMFLAERLGKLNEVYAVNPPQKPGLPLIEVLSPGVAGFREPPLLIEPTAEGA